MAMACSSSIGWLLQATFQDVESDVHAPRHVGGGSEIMAPLFQMLTQLPEADREDGTLNCLRHGARTMRTTQLPRRPYLMSGNSIQHKHSTCRDIPAIELSSPCPERRRPTLSLPFPQKSIPPSIKPHPLSMNLYHHHGLLRQRTRYSWLPPPSNRRLVCDILLLVYQAYAH